MRQHILIGGLGLALGLLPRPLPAAEVTVFAAASLTDALREVATNYTHATGDRLVFNFAGSGTLAQQIRAGAPADLFFSADEAKVEALEQEGLLLRGTRRVRLSNTLVLVAPPGGAVLQTPADLTNAAIRRIALGDPRLVPAGAYAQAYLEKSGLWRQLAGKVVPCENVRAVLAAVESGNVEAGIVYRTDAAISKQVTVVCAVPAGAGPRISYPVALLKTAPAPAAAQKFLDYLAGAAAGAVFARRGFVVLPAPGK